MIAIGRSKKDVDEKANFRQKGVQREEDRPSICKIAEYDRKTQMACVPIWRVCDPPFLL